MQKKDLLEVVKYLSLVTYIGVLMTASIMIGYYIGNYLHKLTGNLLFLIIFIFLGIASGFWSVYKLISKMF